MVPKETAEQIIAGTCTQDQNSSKELSGRTETITGTANSYGTGRPGTATK